MNTLSRSFDAQIAGATLAREFLSYRINRFLYLHLALMLAIGLLALLVPPEAAVVGAAWWVLNGVLYVGSLSALLLGLSSAQAEAEEFAFLFTQPVRIGWWVLGKCAGLALVSGAAGALVVVPTLIAAGGATLLLGSAAAAAGVCVLFAWLGLAIGFWIHDPVRGLIVALVVWCALLFGVDLGLILIGGAEWVHGQRLPWLAALMLSPLDAYRVTLLLVVEGAAFSGSDLHPVTRWWLAHPVAWLTVCLTGWGVAAAGAAVAGAARRRTL